MNGTFCCPECEVSFYIPPGDLLLQFQITFTLECPSCGYCEKFPRKDCLEWAADARRN